MHWDLCVAIGLLLLVICALVEHKVWHIVALVLAGVAFAAAIAVACGLIPA